nr:MAG: hypothetical protein [Bacteriophage sp.]
MGTISDKLMRIINTKEDIRQALISKGYDVPTSIPFKEYAKMILDLPCNADSFPDIEGIVARYSASGLTNEQMAANPVWVDKTGNGHDLQLKNFSWKGMSGIGGYVVDIDEWGTNSTAAYFERNSIKITATFKENASLGLLYHNIKLRQSCVLKVTGIPEGCDAFLDDRLGNRFYMSEDGVYEIIPSNFLAEALYLSIEKYPERWYGSKLTVEQLPLYPGALVFDGVDDYGVCDNFPILTKEKGYTVVALRQWITRGEGALGLVSNVKNWINNGAFLLEYRNIQADHFNKPISFGAIGSENDLPHIFTYQTSKSYNGVSITTGNFEGTDVLHVGKLDPTNVGTCINAAIWELVFLDHDATEEELTKIKDYFVKTYPWLFPDQAWTVTGKTNEDEDRATIANITGNGNDLVLSNFGFAEGSGYGLYYQYFGNEFKATNGEIEGGGWNIIDNYNISHDKRIPINSIGKCFWGNKALVNGIKLRFKLTGMTEGDVLAFGYAATYDLTYTSDGIYAIDLPPVDKPYGFSLQSSLTENLPTTPVTIELLPFQYEGYMVTDGVDDIASSNTFVYEADFTFIGEWKFIQKDNTVAGINSPSHLYIQNRYNRGATVMINSTFENKKNITDYMTFKAITSKGKGYDENWNEVDLLYGDGNKGTSGVNIGGQGGTEFCHMLFKNMALYMNKVFSKDECIKAYNYLQTIKSK